MNTNELNDLVENIKHWLRNLIAPGTVCGRCGSVPTHRQWAGSIICDGCGAIWNDEDAGCIRGFMRAALDLADELEAGIDLPSLAELDRYEQSENGKRTDAALDTRRIYRAGGI